MGHKYPSFFFFIFLQTVSAFAVTPMDYYQSLVAGTGDEGYRDGSFASARFKNPCGLAFDREGEKLYVADSGNNRIRMVDLSKSNEVSTLAGTGTAGSLDGPVSTATLNIPTRLAMMSAGRLAVYEAGDNAIRCLDIAQGSVTTLVKGVAVLDLVYRGQDDNLYFTTQDGKVERLDLKTLGLKDVLVADPQVPSPGPMCVEGEGLVVVDRTTGTAARLALGGPATAASPIGTAKGLLALSSSDGKIYGIQDDGNLVRVGNPSMVLKYPSPWGFLYGNKDHQGEVPLLQWAGGVPVGMTARPDDPRRFYITNSHSVVSVTDYDFEKNWGSIYIPDFDYPVKKPPRTFRILAIGSSRNATAFLFPSDPTVGLNEAADTAKVEDFPKKLEFWLNTEASLRDRDVHFQVLAFTCRGESITTYLNSGVLDIVKRYDIDLVWGLADFTGYQDYYWAPLGKDGVPGPRSSQDFFKKNLSDRSPPGPARDLLERCKALKIPYSEKQDHPGGVWDLFCQNDPSIQADLREMTGKRIAIFQDTLRGLKTSEGTSPHLFLYYFPCRDYPNNCVAPFWKSVCDQYKIDFNDFTEPYNALVRSYHPTGLAHWTPYGNELVTRIMGDFLIEDKLIPFEAGPGTGLGEGKDGKVVGQASLPDPMKGKP